MSAPSASTILTLESCHSNPTDACRSTVPPDPFFPFACGLDRKRRRLAALPPSLRSSPSSSSSPPSSSSSPPGLRLGGGGLAGFSDLPQTPQRPFLCVPPH